MMSDQPDTPVQAPENQVLVPTSQTLTINGTEYSVKPFKIGKTLLMLEIVTELLENTDLVGLLQNSSSTDANDTVRRIIAELPRLLRVGSPILFRAIALTLTPDIVLAEAEQNGQDPRHAFDSLAQRLRFEAETDEVVEVFALGIQNMGLDTLRSSLPKLGAALGLNQQAPN